MCLIQQGQCVLYLSNHRLDWQFLCLREQLCIWRTEQVTHESSFMKDVVSLQRCWKTLAFFLLPQMDYHGYPSWSMSPQSHSSASFSTAKSRCLIFLKFKTCCSLPLSYTFTSMRKKRLLHTVITDAQLPTAILFTQPFGVLHQRSHCGEGPLFGYEFHLGWQAVSRTFNYWFYTKTTLETLSCFF